MAIQLLLVENQGLFDRFHYSEGPQRYTLFRVFIPVFLLTGFALLCYKLFRRVSAEVVRLFFQQIFLFDRTALSKYLLFLLLSFGILSLVPGFTLLIRNLDTQYGFMDIDAYISMIKNMYHGDYNPSWLGGITFGKYYLVTMSTLSLTFLSGMGNVVAAYNIVITILFYFIILNVVFTFRNLFFDKRNGTYEELTAIFFISALVVIFLRFCIFRDYFNNDAILQAYLQGYYGSFGAAYLYTCIIFIFSHLLREGIVDFKQTILITLIITLFSSMLVQSYFNLTLFLLPTSGMILAVLLSRRTSWINTGKLAVLFLAYLILNYTSYLALDIFPRYSMAPITKFNIMSLGLVLSFLTLFLLNRRLNNIPLKVFLKYRSLFVLTLFFLPFLWYCYHSGDRNRIELLGYPIKLGTSRIYFLVLLLYTLVFGCLVFGFLRLTLLRKRKYFLYGLIGIAFLISLFISRAYDAKWFLPFEYPPFYFEERRIMDRSNLYAFDENGIKVTYNKYLVDVIKYFVRNGITDMYYWIVSKTPSQGVYEHGLLQRILSSRDYEIEGITVKHFDSDKEDTIPGWAKTHLAGVTVKDYDDFVKYIFDIGREARVKDTRFKNRYVILDNNFPGDTLRQLDISPLFRKMYENKLYKVYRIESP